MQHTQLQFGEDIYMKSFYNIIFVIKTKLFTVFEIQKHIFYSY